MMISSLIALLLIAVPPSGDAGPQVRLELTDQYGEVMVYPPTVSEAEPPVVLIALADRRGAEANIDWAEELAARYAPHIEGVEDPTLIILPVAHLRSVPKMLRGLVRRMFRNRMVEGEELLPIALDWKGQAEGQLGLDPGVPNVTVLDRGGAVAVQRSGQVEVEGPAVFEVLDRLLKVSVAEGEPSS